MYFEPYCHGDAPTAPVGDENGHIIGVELEISSISDNGEEFLDNLVNMEFLATEDAPDDVAPAVIEYEAQGNVKYEIILRADAVGTIKQHVETLEPLSHYVTNHEETSVHIHLNRAHVQDTLELSQLEIYKAAEAVAPLIWQLSGRNHHAWTEWSPSRLGNYETRETSGLLERFQDIDTIYWKDNGLYSDRYELCNVQNGATIEIRGFSNYCDFNAGRIHTFIDVVADLIPDVALAMRGKTYKEDGETVLKTVAAFLDEHGLANSSTSHWWDYEAELAALKRAKYEEVIKTYQETLRYIKAGIMDANGGRTCKISAAEHLLHAMRLNKAVQLDGLNLQDIKGDALKMEELLHKWFKNAIWRL